MSNEQRGLGSSELSEKVFAEMYSRYKDELTDYVTKELEGEEDVINRPELSADIVQEAFTQLLSRNGQKNREYDLRNALYRYTDKAISKVRQEPRAEDVDSMKEEGQDLNTYARDSTLDYRGNIDKDQENVLEKRGQVIEELLAGFNSREAIVLRMRLGFPHNHLPFRKDQPEQFDPSKEIFEDEHTQEEVGYYYGVQRERIRQIEDSALGIIRRNPAKMKLILPFRLIEHKTRRSRRKEQVMSEGLDTFLSLDAAINWIKGLDFETHIELLDVMWTRPEFEEDSTLYRAFVNLLEGNTTSDVSKSVNISEEELVARILEIVNTCRNTLHKRGYDIN